MSDDSKIDARIRQERECDEWLAELDRAYSARMEAMRAAPRLIQGAPPPGVHLWRWNRRRAAERWPGGALQMCKRLEREHPGWRVSWMAANTISGWERPAGYYATRDDVNLPRADQLRRLPEDGVSRRPVVFGASPAELRVRIAVMGARIALQEAQQEAFYRWTLARLG